MRDRVPTKVLPNGAIRFGEYDENGNLLGYKYIRREDEPTEAGTPNNKANLMPDTLATKLGLASATATVALGLEKTFDAMMYRKIRSVTDVAAQNSATIDLSDIKFDDWRAIRISGNLFGDQGAGTSGGGSVTVNAKYNGYTCQNASITSNATTLGYNNAYIANGVLGVSRNYAPRFELDAFWQWANRDGTGANGQIAITGTVKFFGYNATTTCFFSAYAPSYTVRNSSMANLVFSTATVGHYTGFSNVQIWGVKA